MPYEHIRTVATIFKGLRKKLGIKDNHSKWAAIYYVLLIENFPSDLTTLLNKSKESNYEVNRGNLEIGREILLQKGFIAKAYLSNIEGCDFDNEAFLPINPIILWEENKNIYDKAEPDEKEFRRKRMKELENVYLQNFKNHGFVGTNGDITILYSNQWFAHTIVNNLFYVNGNKNLDIMLSSLGTFDNPHREFYGNILLEQRPKIRAIYDPYSYTYDKITKDEFENRITNAKRYMEKYGNEVEIRCPHITHATSRRVIFDDMAIDARKLLPLNRKEPSYVGTIYLNKNDVDFLRENFNAAWEKSTDIRSPGISIK